MDNKKVKVLLIEDSVDDAALLKRKLENSAKTRFVVNIVTKLEDGLEHIAREPPDLIISDLGLPDSQGLDTVKRIFAKAPHVPLVVLSGLDDESVAIKAVKAGAQDYLVKGQIENSQLERSLHYSIERAGLQQELEQHQREIVNFQNNLNKVLEKNADAILITNKNNQILFSNPAAESIMGRTQKVLQKEKFNYILIPGVTQEIEIKRPDATKKTVEMTVVDVDWEDQPACLVSIHDVSRRKQMEQAIAESEEKFSKVFLHLPESISITRVKDNTFLDANESFCQNMGLKREDIIGHTANELGLTNKLTDRKMMIKHIKEQDTIFRQEYQGFLPKGQPITTLISADIVDINNEPSMVVIATDITERTQMERALKESEEKFSKTFQAIPESISISRVKDGVFLDINEVFCRATGHSREKVIGHTADEIGLSNPADQRTKIIKTIKEKGPIQNLELVSPTPTGQMNTFLFSADIIDISGEPCLISINTDITQRKKMEQTIAESEEKFAKVFLHNPEVILITDINDSTIIDANDTFMRQTGATRDAVIGSKITDFVTWADPDARQNMIKVIKEKQIISNLECVFSIGKGEYRTWLFSGEIINIGGRLRILSVIIDITERKKTEDRLRFSDTALKSIREGVFALDNDFKITQWNDMCEQMFGCKAPEAIGKTVSDVVDMIEQYPGQNEERLNLLFKKGFNREEQHYRTPHGEIWVDVQTQEINYDGKRYGWLTLLSDITERKKMEDKLRFSDFALKSIHEGVYAMDNDLKVTYWNEMCEQMFGVKASDAIGKHPQDSMNIIEVYKGQIEQRIDTILKHGFSRDEQIYRTPHGDIWVDVKVQAIEFNGKRYGWLTLLSDITTRKEAEEALKSSEEKYRELINTSNDAIVSIDSQQNFGLWNKGAEKLLGYTEKEMIGLSVMTIFPPNMLKDVAREIIKIKKTSLEQYISRVFETSLLKKDCSLVPVDVSISARLSGEATITTVIMRDITVRKEAEAKLKQIDQMKSDFLSNISHELRTPLQSISGFTKLIMNGDVPDQPTQQEFLQIIDRETIHLGNLVNGLLDMSRLEIGRFQINRKPTVIRDTIIEALKIFVSLSHEKNVKLLENLPANLPVMNVDDERMRQVVVNLVGNAIKFSDPGSSITVDAEIKDDTFLFRVTDHGTGIREENMKHLFERFYREEGETARGGTGLGLYISKQIIDAHGGRIWAESILGKGSTFSFSLPLDGKGGDTHG